MNDNYTPQVGDWVRRVGWLDTVPDVQVTAIGREYLLAVDKNGEDTYNLDERWRKVDPPAKRYVVEIREAQEGERWIDRYGEILDGPTPWRCAAIVEVLS